jgi:iron complex transport system ATP-binding protein
MANISLQELDVSYSNHKIICNANLNFMKGKITSILGPNGSGKSTLLKAISGSVSKDKGKVWIDGKLLEKYQRKELAKKIAILPQSPETPKDITVKQLVSYGRYAHQTFLNQNKNEDTKKIEWALSVTHLNTMAHKTMGELSGGQKQRAWIAMSLAQNSNCLFLDELTSYLDIRHQLEILDLLKNLNETEGKTIIMVLHDINHALQFSDYIAVVKEGEIICYETVKNILQSKILDSVFKVHFKVLYDEKNKPFIFTNGLIN